MRTSRLEGVEEGVLNDLTGKWLYKKKQRMVST